MSWRDSIWRRRAKRVRGLAERGDPMCRDIFRVQAHALGLFFDEMINTFDPDALIVGGGAIETAAAFRHWFLDEIRAGMPAQREEQADIPIHVMPERRHRRRPRRRHRGAEARAGGGIDIVNQVQGSGLGSSRIFNKVCKAF